jgi:hypothetical protein
VTATRRSATAIARAAVLAVLATAAAAQAQWRLTGDGASACIAGAEPAHIEAGERLELGAGDFAVHFPADARGKPISLAFPVGAGDTVELAIDGAGPAPARVLPIDGDGSREFALAATGSAPLHLRTRVDGADESDYRISVTIDAGALAGVSGLVARCRPDGDCYALLLDAGAGRLSLERWLGGDRFVLHSAACELPEGPNPTLTLQADGFRLQGYIDDAVVVQVFDGALSQGAVGVAWRSERPEFSPLTLAPPAKPRASTALVRSRGAATLHAAVSAPAGSLHVLELSLDRPHPLVPRDAAGFEPWLCQRPAAPQVLLGDFRDSLGANSFGELPVDGHVEAVLRWRELPALVTHVALVRVLIADPAGDAITERAPAAPLVF